MPTVEFQPYVGITQCPNAMTMSEAKVKRMESFCASWRCERDIQDRSKQPGSRSPRARRHGPSTHTRAQGNHCGPWVCNDYTKAVYGLIRDTGYRLKTADVDQHINCYGNQGSAADIPWRPWVTARGAVSSLWAGKNPPTPLQPDPEKLPETCWPPIHSGFTAATTTTWHKCSAHVLPLSIGMNSLK